MSGDGTAGRPAPGRAGRSWRRLLAGWWALTAGQRALLATAAVLAAVCGWLLTPPAGLDDGAGADAGAPADLPTLPEPTGAPEGTDALVAGNVFARSRRPPEERWLPEEERRARAEARRREEPARVERAPDPAARASGYRLVGTVVAGSSGGTFAVIEADPSTPGPEIYRHGDRIGPFRVGSIRRDRVVLDLEGRRVELWLDPDARSGDGDGGRSRRGSE